MNLLQQNFFQLFNLPEHFHLDLNTLDQAYRLVQNQVHPDRHIHAGAAQQRLAQQWASHANEAYRTLRQPLARAAYLCGLRGQDVHNEESAIPVKMPLDFLMQQMTWREALTDAMDCRDLKTLTLLRDEVKTVQQKEFEQVATQLDVNNHVEIAVVGVRKLLFIEKIMAELDRNIEVLKNNHGSATNF